MKEWITILQNWVPLFQTLSWVSIIIFIIIKFSSKLESLFEIILLRVQSGSSLKAGPVKLGADLNSLEKISPGKASVDNPRGQNWSTQRSAIYEKNQGLFLTHVIRPSQKVGQEYDVFIYLIRHKQDKLDDIEYAEFFLGGFWGNKVYKESVKNNLVGISTSAYGPFLCTCRVKMKNGDSIQLNRYIDFEMGRYIQHV